MKLKVYFDVHFWTNQDNIFFWANVPTTQCPEGGKRYVAEIEVPDADAVFDKADVLGISEI